MPAMLQTPAAANGETEPLALHDGTLAGYSPFYDRTDVGWGF
jgi:hypothetical protein